MDTLSIVEFDPQTARLAARWRYEPPFDLYDGDQAQAALFLDRDDAPFGYNAILDPAAELVGYCCFGPEARVRGQQPQPGTLDVGGGLRPDLVGRGVATAFFPTILEFGAASFSPKRFRTTVAAFNERSLRLCLSAGFTIARTFDGPGREFHELVRSGRMSGPP